MIKRLPKQKERGVKAAIKRWLARLAPGLWDYMPVQSALGAHGIPDHIACVPVIIPPEWVGKRVGLFVAVEAKSESGSPTERQLDVIAKIAAAGGIVGVVYGPSASVESQLKQLLGPITDGIPTTLSP